jgi:Tfp pilus assembly protein PilV
MKHITDLCLRRSESIRLMGRGVAARPVDRESGFSLIEACVAILVLTIALLGAFQAFTYAIGYNAGNKVRAQALSVMQEEVELLRSAKFTPSFTDPALQGTGTSGRTRTVTASSGSVFTVTDVVDNDPTVVGIQPEGSVCLTPQGAATPCTLKEITITVSLAAPSPGWQTARPATTILRRTRGN